MQVNHPEAKRSSAYEPVSNRFKRLSFVKGWFGRRVHQTTPTENQDLIGRQSQGHCRANKSHVRMRLESVFGGVKVRDRVAFSFAREPHVLEHAPIDRRVLDLRVALRRWW